MDQRPPHKTRFTESNRRQSEEELRHSGTGEIFLNKTPMDHAVRSHIGKCNLIKLKSFCMAKDTVNKTKWQLADWEKIVSIPIIED